MTKNSKAKDTSDSENETEVEKFIFEHLKIILDGNTEWGKICKERLSKPKSCAKHTFNQNKSYSISKIINPTVKTKNKHYRPILVGVMNCRLGKSNFHSIKILLDYKVSSLILPVKHMKNLLNKKTTSFRWKNQGGKLQTKHQSKV